MGKNSFTWLIETQSDNTVIGSYAARRHNFKVDVGYLLLKKYWGQHIMTEITQSFIQKAFEIEGIERVGAVCDIENLASKRVMEKAGMSYEGILKRWMIAPNISNKPRNCHCLSIVKSQTY